MRSRLFAVALCCLAVAACKSSIQVSADMEDLLKNPLYAEWYYDDLTNHLVNMEIQNDPVLEDSAMKAKEDAARKEALAKAKEATKLQSQGRVAKFVREKTDAMGEVLVLGDKLYLGPDFSIVPGVELHLYGTSLESAADIRFPEQESFDLGLLKSPYGPQEYSLSSLPEGTVIRSVAVWDAAFNQLHGYAVLPEAPVSEQ